MRWLLLLCVPLGSSQQLGLYPKAFPECLGPTELVTIDMSADGKGRPLGTGDQPATLPEGITVSGRRRGNAENNDLLVLDTSKENIEGLEEFDEGGVLIIGGDSARGPPNGRGPKGNIARGKGLQKMDEAENGGRLIFRFRKPIYQLTNLRVLSVNKTSESYITGRDSRGRRLDTFVIPTRGENNDTTVDPSDWYNVRLLEIVLGGAGAISNLMITVCRGGRYLVSVLRQHYFLSLLTLSL